MVRGRLLETLRDWADLEEIVLLREHSVDLLQAEVALSLVDHGGILGDLLAPEVYGILERKFEEGRDLWGKATS